MTGPVRSTVALLIGVVTLRVALSELMFNYVRPAMRPWLIASGAVLCLLGVVGFLRANRPGIVHDDHDDDHPPSRAAWLLLLPVLAVSLITPDALGSFAANRQSTERSEPLSDLGPLPTPTRGAVQLTLSEFTDRALFDEQRSLDDVNVRLIGFVGEPTGTDADFVLSRFLINCCAADARAVEVEIYGAPAPPPDTWVEVTGKWRRPATEDMTGVASLDAADVTRISQPEVPYE